ncbi:MAG TPA: hypothetical protein VF316_02960 [Polyangiaceae bacterium]
MGSRHLAFAWAPLALGFATACSNHPSIESAQASAASDLQCSSVVLEELDSNGCEAGQVCKDEWRATGCRQTARYLCTGNREGYTCERLAHTTQSSSVTINGVPLVPDGQNACRSGEGQGQAFYGVDLTAPRGDTLRIIRNPDMSFDLVAGSAGLSSPPMRGCATVRLGSDSLAGLSGDAAIDCASGAWSIKGNVTFKGCE